MCNRLPTSYERIVTLCFHQAKEGSSAWWSGCLHAEVSSTSTKPRLGEVLGRLVVTMPRSNRRRCCRPRLNQLFGRLAVSLPRSNGWPSTSTRKTGSSLAGHLYAEVPCPSVKPRLELLLSPCQGPTDGDAVGQGLIICLVGLLSPCQGPTDGQAHINKVLGPWSFHQAKTRSAVWWTSYLHANVPDPSKKPRLGQGHLGWWARCQGLPAKV